MINIVYSSRVALYIEKTSSMIQQMSSVDCVFALHSETRLHEH